MNRKSQNLQINSETKKNLFSGRDSLLRKIITNTPRSFNNDPKGDTTNQQYLMNQEIKEDNSDAATKKRVEVSNFGGAFTPGSSTSSHFFENNSSFQKFSLLQFNNMMESKDFGVLLQLREKAIKYREKAEKKMIDKMIKSQKYSPRMLQQRKIDLEIWVSKEKEEIKKTKTNLLEKWNQTKEVLEQTEENARMIKNQLGSIDCSRKASLNFASPMSEHCLESLNHESYHEERKTNKSGYVDEDEETKVIHFSEPQRMVQSDSDLLGGNNSNSAISLRISVLSNKSEEIDLNYKHTDFYKLQRTRDLGRISQLIPTEMIMDRKNHSETFYVGNAFQKLLEESGSEKVIVNKEILLKQDSQKVFEYKPQQPSEAIEEVKETKEEEKEAYSIERNIPEVIETVERKSDNSSEKSVRNDEELDKNTEKVSEEEVSGEKVLEEVLKPKVEEINHEENLELIEEKEKKEIVNHSSHSSLSIEKVDDLNMENLLEVDDVNSDSNSFTRNIENQFSEKVDTNFLRDLNQEISQEDIVLGQVNFESEAEKKNKELDFSNDTDDKNLEEEKIETHYVVDENTETDFDEDFYPEELKGNSSVPSINSENLVYNDQSKLDLMKNSFLTGSFSPQNMATKLINSLKNKDSSSQNCQDMLIYDDVDNNKTAVDMVHHSDLNKDIDLDNEDECIDFHPVISVHTKPKEESQEDKIANDLLSQLVSEIKESLFPPRQTMESIFTVNDASA